MNNRSHFTQNESLKFSRAREDFCWNQDRSHPDRPGTDGTAERIVRRVEERTSALIVPYGLADGRWVKALKMCLTRAKQNKDSLVAAARSLLHERMVDSMVLSHRLDLRCITVRSP